MTEATTPIVQTVAPTSADLQVVTVVFSEARGEKEYYYFAPASAKANHYAVVYDSRRPAAPNNGSDFPFKIVRITRANVIDVEGRANKAVWGVFDETFARFVAQRIEQLAQVKAQLAAKRKTFEEQELYRVMAQHDPEVGELLNQLNNFRF